MNCHCEEREKGVKDRSITVEEGKLFSFFSLKHRKPQPKNLCPNIFFSFLVSCCSVFFIFSFLYFIYISVHAHGALLPDAREGRKEGRKKKLCVVCTFSGILFLFFGFFECVLLLLLLFGLFVRLGTVNRLVERPLSEL